MERLTAFHAHLETENFYEMLPGQIGGQTAIAMRGPGLMGGT